MEIGIIANPASGKDIRRVTAKASVFNNREKAAMIGRLLAGIGSTSDISIKYLADSHRIVESMVKSLNVRAEKLEVKAEGTEIDSIRAAEQLQGAAVVVSLGGDGTNRAIAKGWLDVPLIALSTGTNNAFPVFVEATNAGIAAKLIARGEIDVASVSTQVKVVHVDFEEHKKDLALIDVVGTSDRFTGSRAIVDPSKCLFAVLSVADPHKVGMTSVGGCFSPVGAEADAGLVLKFASQESSSTTQLFAPIAPGLVQQISIEHGTLLPLEQSVRFNGPAMLAFDGERDRRLGENQSVTITVKRDGPRLIDIAKTLRVAAGVGLFRLPHKEGEDYAN